jgi:hypothetical protein
MTTEGAAASRIRLAFVLGGALLVVAHLTVDAARARLAASPERRSALLAWLSGTWLVIRHPLRTGAATLAGLLCGPAVAFLLLGLRERLPGGPGWAVVAGVLLAQLAAAAVGWGRAVRLVALARIARGDREARHAPTVVAPGA